jgi:predicted XRE-type DNA-binding protein
LEYLRANLAARIFSALDAQQFTADQASAMTGFAAAQFARIRRAKLERFTIDHLMTMLVRLDATVEVTITDRPRRHAEESARTSRPV